MNNILELRNHLAQIFSSLQERTLDIREASELNNTAGKIISTLKVQLVYAALRKERPDIAFLQNSVSSDLVQSELGISLPEQTFVRPSSIGLHLSDGN